MPQALLFYGDCFGWFFEFFEVVGEVFSVGFIESALISGVDDDGGGEFSFMSRDEFLESEAKLGLGHVGCVADGVSI